MKPRKWVIVFAVFAFICGSAGYRSITFLEKNKNLERFLGKTISSSIGGKFSVGRVKIGFLSVYLENVTIALATHYYAASVPDIKISFSLFKLVRSKGDIGRSVSKIIFINPRLDIFLTPQKNVASSARPSTGPLMGFPDGGADVYSIVNNFPVDQFLIRKGCVRVFDREGQGVPLGEDLSGSLKNDAAGMHFELRGGLASGKKNLFCSAVFSRKYHRNHVSVRLDRANIGKPIRCRALEIRSGTLDGVCEFSFPDTITPRTFESAGWVRIRNGGASIDNIEKPISAAMLSISLDNTFLRIDSAGCVWNGIKMKGAGAWNAAVQNDPASVITVQCENIRMESIFPKKNSGIAGQFRGNGWAKAVITKRPLTSEHALSITGGGISFAGLPLLCSVKALFTRTQVSVESFTARSSGMTATGSGIVNFEKSMPVYSASYSIVADSLPQIPGFRGSRQLSARGSLHGLGPKTRCEGMIVCEKANLFGVNIGRPEISVTLDTMNRLIFDISKSNRSYICASGILDSVFGKKNHLRAIVMIGDSAIKSMLGKNNSGIARSLDSSWIRGNAVLSGDYFELQGQAGLRSVFARGIFRFHIEKSAENRMAHWRVSQQQLTMGDSMVAFSASGSLSEKTIILDTLNAFGGLRGSGRYDLDPAILDAFVQCRDIPLCALNTWFFNRKIPLKTGSLSGKTRISGAHGRISTDSELHLRRCAVGYLTNIDADAILRSRDTLVTLLPMTIRKDNKELVSIDTISSETAVFSGRFHDVPLRSLLETDFAVEDTGAGINEPQGLISGEFKSISTGLPVEISGFCPFIEFGKWRVDSVRARCAIGTRGIDIKDLNASDADRASLDCSGKIPWSVLSNQHADDDTATRGDTMDMRVKAEGDLMASFEKNIGLLFNAPLNATGKGAIEIQIRGTPGNVRICKAKGGIPRGTLSLKPYVPYDIDDFSVSLAIDSDSLPLGYDSASAATRIKVDMNGTIGKRPFHIYSTHKIPNGFEPLRTGFIDAGIIQITTPKGIDLHLPGLMEPGITADIEFAPKPPFTAFTISGPSNRPVVTGTWVLRNGEFTYPTIKSDTTSSGFNPLPSIVWDLDVKAANRKVKYYYDAAAKRQRFMRLVECYLDPISKLSIRGRKNDNTFILLGALRSYKGSVFFRKVFDLNFEAGLDFAPQPLPKGKGFDNRPIIWGSAEAVSEKNRFDRTKITLVTRDSITGAVSEKGRFYGIRFKVTSGAEEIPGESEIDFVSTEGKRMASMEGAEELVSTMGEQYVHRFLLQNIENRLAKSLGLDVITFETSIASNYFNKIYNKQLVNLSYDWNYLAFANVGITLGRYFFYDKVFLKWRTELVPVDTLIRPEYTMGFEFQPLNYFMMDFDYGMRLGQKSLSQNPKVYMQLRLPIENVRKYLNF